MPTYLDVNAEVVGVYDWDTRVAYSPLYCIYPPVKKTNKQKKRRLVLRGEKSFIVQ